MNTSTTRHDADETSQTHATAAGDAAAIELIELLFFAYRDFVAEPDAVLDHYGFGRAHHRVLHFVNRNPGLTVAELLDILKITKQSLSRVLRQMIDEGFISQRAGTADRRQRRLFVSDKGAELAAHLLELQIARVTQAKALATMDEVTTEDAGAAFLRGLIDAGERAKVLDRVASGREPVDGNA
ncbi:MAG: MarR family transcriptional regulator [Pseudomonadota bacterium]